MKTGSADYDIEHVPAVEPIGAWAAWDRFWFKPADPTTLSFIRVCAGFVVFYIHIAYCFGLLDYVGPEAWLDTRVTKYLRSDVEIFAPSSDWFGAQPRVDKGHYIWSIYFNVTDPFWIRVTHAGILVAMFLFAIGLWTRVTSVLTCVGALCYLHRAPTTLFGMDTMMNILLIYLMIGPSGATLSVDRWLQLRRERKLGIPPSPPEPSVSANFAIRMMQIHFCIIYMASGLSKLLGAAWWNGTAVWGTFANYSFAPMKVSLYYNLLLFLAKHRWLWEIAMTGGAIFTLVLEISLPYLIWLPRTRWWMICGSAMLHTGIGLTMGLVTFSLMMLCLLFSFVPPEAVHHLIDRFTGKAGFFTRPLDRAEMEHQTGTPYLEPAHSK